MFYLPYLSHFLDSKTKADADSVSDHKVWSITEENFISSHHSSSSSANESEAAGSLSITSNTRTPANGKSHLPSATKDFVSPNCDISSQDLAHFTEADTFQFDDNAHTVNSKDMLCFLKWRLIKVIPGIRKEEDRICSYVDMDVTS